MTIKHKIQGESMQMVICQLEPEQTIYAEAGKFLWKTANVTVETRLTRPDDEGGKGAPTPPGGGGSGGLLNKALKVGKEVGKRALAGESLAFQYYRAAGGSGLITFAGVLPGHVQAIELDGTTSWLAEKDAFVAAEHSVHFDIAFSGFKTGRKGGEGFILEKFSGVGTVLIAGAGNFVTLNPAHYGGKIQLDTGCLVAFEESVTYGVERVGELNAQTVMTGLMGGEGFNLATLEGDGRVIIQSMTYAGMGAALRRHVLGGQKGNTENPLGSILSSND